MTDLGDRLVPSLMVRDVARSVAFYTGVLGFEVTGREEDERGPLWAEVRRGPVVIQLGRGPLCGLPEEPVMTGTLYLFPERLEPVETLVRGRAEVAWGPEDMPYGRRELAIRDPDGYLIAFSVDTDGRREDPP